MKAGMKAVNRECQHHLLEIAHLGLAVPPSPCLTIRSLASLLWRQEGNPDADTGADSEELMHRACAKLITVRRAVCCQCQTYHLVQSKMLCPLMLSLCEDCSVTVCQALWAEHRP